MRTSEKCKIYVRACSEKYFTCVKQFDKCAEHKFTNLKMCKRQMCKCANVRKTVVHKMRKSAAQIIFQMQKSQICTVHKNTNANFCRVHNFVCAVIFFSLCENFCDEFKNN